KGRSAAPGELDVPRQLDGQLVVRDRNGAVGITVDDRDRRAPVALPGDQPVPQAIYDRSFPDAALLRILRDRVLPRLGARSGERSAAYHHALADVGLVQRGVLHAVRRDDLADLQLVLLRELEVALVVSGNGHDRAGPIGRQDVVGDEDRDALTREHVSRERTDVDAGLLALRSGALDLGHVARAL